MYLPISGHILQKYKDKFEKTNMHHVLNAAL